MNQASLNFLTGRLYYNGYTSASILKRYLLIRTFWTVWSSLWLFFHVFVVVNFVHLIFALFCFTSVLCQCCFIYRLFHVWCILRLSASIYKYLRTLCEHLRSLPIVVVVRVAHIISVLCCIFVFCWSSSCVLCTHCFQCLWIVHSWLRLRFSLTFIYGKVSKNMLSKRIHNKCLMIVARCIFDNVIK
jgi:hypothetical protein